MTLEKEDKQDKIPCTVGILTLNCAELLKKCLESVKDFAEVIVMDGNSTDGTLEVAKQYGCRIERQFATQEPNQVITDFSEVRNRLLKMASYDWYLSLDSDEFASPELVSEVRKIIQEPQGVYLYNAPAKFVLNGKVIQYSSGYPGYEIYLVNLKETDAHYVKPVYEVIDFDRNKYKLGNLKGGRLCLFNEVDTDFAIWKKKMGHYIKMQIAMTDDKNFFYFFKWRIYKQLILIAKALIKITWVYLRHGFSETLPPRLEFQRVYFYVWLTGAYIADYFKKLFK